MHFVRDPRHGSLSFGDHGDHQAVPRHGLLRLVGASATRMQRGGRLVAHRWKLRDKEGQKKTVGRVPFNGRRLINIGGAVPRDVKLGELACFGYASGLFWAWMSSSEKLLNVRS